MPILARYSRLNVLISAGGGAVIRAVVMRIPRVRLGLARAVTATTMVAPVSITTTMRASWPSISGCLADQVVRTAGPF